MKVTPPDVQAEVLALHFGQKLGSRNIARRLGIDRKTVKRIIRDRQVKLVQVPSSSRSSILDPYKARVEEMLKKDPALTATRILQQIRTEGFLGGHSTLKVYVRRVRAVPHRSREAFLRLDLFFNGALPLKASLHRVYSV